MERAEQDATSRLQQLRNEILRAHTELQGHSAACEDHLAHARDAAAAVEDLERAVWREFHIQQAKEEFLSCLAKASAAEAAEYDAQIAQAKMMAEELRGEREALEAEAAGCEEAVGRMQMRHEGVVRRDEDFAELYQGRLLEGLSATVQTRENLRQALQAASGLDPDVLLTAMGGIAASIRASVMQLEQHAEEARHRLAAVPPPPPLPLPQHQQLLQERNSFQDQQWEYEDLQHGDALPTATSAAHHAFSQSVSTPTKFWSAEQDPLPQGPGLPLGGGGGGGEPALRGIFGSPTKLTPPVWADQRTPQPPQAPNSPQQQPSQQHSVVYYRVGSSQVPLGLTAGGGQYLHPALHPAAVPYFSPPPPSPSAAAAAALALASFTSPRGGDGDDGGGGGGVQFVHPRELQRSPGFPLVLATGPPPGSPSGRPGMREHVAMV